MARLHRRDFLRTMGLGAAALAVPRCLQAEDKAAQKPNILYIMSDDHAAHAIASYGGRLAKVTPTANIDRLATEGMLMENVFCTNSICVPSRATILTGQYSQTNGLLTLRGGLVPEKQYLPRLMKQAGYLTAMIGKWHLKYEPAFDYYNVLPGQGSYSNPTTREAGKPWGKNSVKHKGHCSDVLMNICLKWLKGRDKTKPFFLMHHFKAPHDMFQNAPRFNKFLADVDVPEPASLYESGDHGSVATRGENDSQIHKIGTSVSKRHTRRNMGKHMRVDPKLPDKEYTHQAYQRYLKRYLRCVKGIDENVGRLLAYLKEEGILDNTIIMYTSDQGMMLGEHDYIDKRWMYEESLRMPMLVRHPATIKAGSRSDAIINNTDFAPTILDLAGAKAPDYMHGRSFAPILRGKTPADWPKATYYRYWMHMAHHSNPAHFGVRTKQHKLIFFYGTGTDGGNPTQPGWELYDLKKDPHEMKNVYNDPKYAPVIKELKAEMLRLRKRFNETDQKYPQIRKVIEEYWDK